MSDALDLAASATPALLTPTATLSYRALAARIAHPTSRAPSALRAAHDLATFLALHEALAHRRALAPLPSSATDAELAAHAAALPAGEDAFAFIRTSGTTGAPRLVELSRRAAVAHAESANAHLGIVAADRWLVALPLCHMGGLAILLRCLAARAAVILDAPPPLGASWPSWLHACIARTGATWVSLVPAQLDCALKDPRRAPASLRGVLVGGQALPPTLAARALARGWPLVVSYGLTETAGMCIATSPGDELALGTVGRPLPGVRVRLADGLLEVHTASRATVVHGAPALPLDGWLRTSDRALLEEGCVRILGRADELIVTGGHKVNPHEVEAALRCVPWVKDVAVFGVPDERFGQAVAAVLVIEDGPGAPGLVLDDGAGAPGLVLDDGAGAPGLARRLREALPCLPSYKRPRHVRVVAALPRLGNDKLDRRAVRALL